MAVSREQWEAAARAHGLEVVAEPQCPECDGAGEVLQRSGYADPCSCEGDYRPWCPMSGEAWAPGTMAWVRSDDYRRPAPTMRGTALESVGGAL